jgi:hypothetical protein
MIAGFIDRKLLHSAKLKGFVKRYSEIIDVIRNEYPHAHFHRNPLILIGAYRKAKREFYGSLAKKE